MSILRQLIERDTAVLLNNPADQLYNLPLTGGSSDERAANLLNRLGCRTWLEDNAAVIGYWPDLDGPEFQTALQFQDAPVTLRSLDGSDVPDGMELRSVPLRRPGEPLFRWLNRSAALVDATQSIIPVES